MRNFAVPSPEQPQSSPKCTPKLMEAMEHMKQWGQISSQAFDKRLPWYPLLSFIRPSNPHRRTCSHRITQHPPRSPFSNVSRAALVAASKTSSTPSPVRDEHSKYFRAPISCAASLPSLEDVKCMDFFRISSIASGSSRRSFFSPTRIIGTLGHRSLASSTH